MFSIMILAAMLFAAPAHDDSCRVDQARMCQTCGDPSEFSAEAVRLAHQKPGRYCDLVANPETGKMYFVDYEVTQVSGGQYETKVESIDRASAETEVQFMDIVAAAKSSPGRVEPQP